MHQPTPDQLLDSWALDRGPQARRWTIQLSPDVLEICDHAGTMRLDGAQAADRVRLRPRLLRGPEVRGTDGAGTSRRLVGLGRRDGRRLADAIDRALVLRSCGRLYARGEFTSGESDLGGLRAAWQTTI